MSIRGERTSLGSISTLTPPHKLVSLSVDDPFSPQFNPSCGDSSRDITTYLLALQKQVYGETCLKYLPYIALQKNIIRLLKLYSPLQIKKAVRLSTVARFPCSTKFIKYLIGKYFNEESNL